jgi:alpha/beta superfamily hydrolase
MRKNDGLVDHLADLAHAYRAHGFSANKLMSLSPYAEAFAERGYACLVFDYRRWGASGQFFFHQTLK